LANQGPGGSGPRSAGHCWHWLSASWSQSWPAWDWCGGTRASPTINFLFRNGDPAASSVLILGYLAVILALVFAARLAGWSASDYLALVRPRGRYVLFFGLFCVLLPPLITFAHALQFDVSQLFNPHGFDRARAANGLAVHAIEVALAAPMIEEILFRGFLYRGLSESRIGVVGTIILTSVTWALMHVGARHGRHDRYRAARRPVGLVALVYGLDDCHHSGARREQCPHFGVDRSQPLRLVRLMSCV